MIQDKNLLGESPIWNYFDSSLYWVDIDDYKVKKYSDEKGIITYNMKKKPTCLAVIDVNTMMIALEDGIGIYDYRNESYNYLAKIDNKSVRLNDGKCDKNGILHIGSMCLYEPKEPIGTIYNFKNGNLNELIPNIGISNGISFDKNNTMYYADSLQKTIYKYDTNNTVIHSYNDYCPDGSTIDINNNYYSCLWEGYGIDIFNNDIKEDYLSLPCKFTTCCCFGGENMNKLFVTSAYNNTNDCGNIHVLDLHDTTGIKEPVFSYN